MICNRHLGNIERETQDLQKAAEYGSVLAKMVVTEVNFVLINCNEQKVLHSSKSVLFFVFSKKKFQFINGGGKSDCYSLCPPLWVCSLLNSFILPVFKHKTNPYATLCHQTVQHIMNEQCGIPKVSTDIKPE